MGEGLVGDHLARQFYVNLQLTAQITQPRLVSQRAADHTLGQNAIRLVCSARPMNSSGDTTRPDGKLPADQRLDDIDAVSAQAQFGLIGQGQGALLDRLTQIA